MGQESILLRRNHKSARSDLNEEYLVKTIDKEVEHGWVLPLTIDSIRHIKNAGVVPLGVAEQCSINKKIKRYTKRHITHDCSFPGPLGLFMNSRVPKDTLQPCFYGFCLLRILHMIADMHIILPAKHIPIGKTDPNDAYRRVHANIQIAVTCIAIVGKLAFLCLRLPFGTTPAPEEYTTIGEEEIDLGNDLLAYTSWDSTDLQSPHRHLLTRKDYLPVSDPLAKADELAVNIEARETSID